MIREKVEFLVDRDVEAQGKVRMSFKAGKVYELPAASAKRWINRGVAKAVKDIPKRPAVKKKATAPKTKPLADFDLPKKVDREAIDKRTSDE